MAGGVADGGVHAAAVCLAGGVAGRGAGGELVQGGTQPLDLSIREREPVFAYFGLDVDDAAVEVASTRGAPNYAGTPFTGGPVAHQLWRHSRSFGHVNHLRPQWGMIGSSYAMQCW